MVSVSGAQVSFEELDKGLVAGISCLILALPTSMQTSNLQSQLDCSHWDWIDVPGALGLCCPLRG